MRVWDISPGYLNRQSLLGEHRELHGIYVILRDGKTGYARHPETRRWVASIDALARRHSQLAAEMALRGFEDRTPLIDRAGRCRWPDTFVTDPVEQFALLRQKYLHLEPGRIPLPRNLQQLWAQHKYSVMARSVPAYRRLGRMVARRTGSSSMMELTRELVAIQRERPPRSGVANAVEHMWGHVRPYATVEDVARFTSRAPELGLTLVQSLAMEYREPYLMCSTALSDLALYCSRS